MTRTLAVLLATVGAGTLSVVAAPFRAVTPGPLAAGHARLRDDCFACHAPLAGPRSARCARCHLPDAVGVRTVDGRPRPAPGPKAFVPGLHRALAAEDCQRCHVEHGGGARPRTGVRFGHEVLPAAARSECASCHSGQRPRDTLHVETATACGSCHRTERWKPARYDHDRLFRFDGDHPPRCTDCHTVPGDLRRYSCMGCHEHARPRMVAEHREVRVRALDACAECHRSADEHDRRGREGGAREAPGLGGSEGEREEEDGEEEDDDD